MMITILYIYKNKDAFRVKRSLESLRQQTDQRFQVLFVDYGSTSSFKDEIIPVINTFDFVKYHYSYHCAQAWSRAKAINIGLRLIETPFVFVADIDMIFRNDFVAKLHQLKDHNKSIYFKVGFLNQKESTEIKDFNQYTIQHVSSEGAKGLSLFPLKALNEIQGFDEFLHFWGAEDEDIHQRLQNHGLSEVFYNDEILMLHQWHLTYRNAENNQLTQELRVLNITRINSNHLKYNSQQHKTVVNTTTWGTSITKEEYVELHQAPISITLTNKKEVIDHFIFHQLNEFHNGILAVTIVEDAQNGSLKSLLKRSLNKTVPQFYSLKEVNDTLLLHIVSFYRNNNYIYNVSKDLKSIEFKIKK